MSKVFDLVLVTLLSLVPISTASATTITTDNGNPTGNSTGQIIYDFETSATTPLITGNYIITTGSVVNVYAAPEGDTSHYMAVPYYSNLPTSATINFTSEMNYLGLYWGSIDGNDTLTFLDHGLDVLTITGDDVWPETPKSTGVYVNISSIPAFDAVEFSRYINAFEFDNIAVSPVDPVPEPATMLLFGIGLAGLVARGRKKRN